MAAQVTAAQEADVAPPAACAADIAFQIETTEQEQDEDDEEAGEDGEEEEEEEELALSCCSGDGRLSFLLGCPPLLLPVPSQSPQETHPLPLYTLCGLPGMLEGRCPLFLHSLHSLQLFRPNMWTNTRPSRCDSILSRRTYFGTLFLFPRLTLAFPFPRPSPGADPSPGAGPPSAAVARARSAA